MKNKLLSNVKWIVLCRAAQNILQLIVGMLCARYLGPSNYGLINYAKALVAIVLPISQLGLNFTLVQEVIDNPEKEGEVMGTSILLQMVSSLACLLLIFSFVSTVNKGETETQIVCILYSVSIFFQALSTMKYWFHSKLLAKYPSIVMLISYVIVSAYKIYLLVSGKNVYWFAVVSTVEYGVIAFCLWCCFKRLSHEKISVSIEMACKMLAKSKYYIMAAIMVVALNNIDHIMLKTILGDAENGYYSAAITSAIVVEFFYHAIIDTFRPVVLNNKKQSQEEYENTLSKLYGIIVSISLLQSLVFTIMAKPIILILYGKQYIASVPVLRILVWFLAFSYIGYIRNIWILAEEKHSLLWRINLCGVLANVVLNALLIPRWGACGAAAASVITLFFTNVVVGFIMKDIRPNNRLMLKGLNPRFAISSARELLQKVH